MDDCQKQFRYSRPHWAGKQQLHPGHCPSPLLHYCSLPSMGTGWHKPTAPRTHKDGSSTFPKVHRGKKRGGGLELKQERIMTVPLGQSSSMAGYSEKLYRFHPWRFLGPNWIKLWATSSYLRVPALVETTQVPFQPITRTVLIFFFTKWEPIKLLSTKFAGKVRLHSKYCCYYQMQLSILLSDLLLYCISLSVCTAIG